MMKVMEKFPILKDAAVISYLDQEFVDRIHLWAAAVGAVFVVALGWLIRRAKHKGPFEQPLITDPPGPEEFPPRTR